MIIQFNNNNSFFNKNKANIGINWVVLFFIFSIVLVIVIFNESSNIYNSYSSGKINMDKKICENNPELIKSHYFNCDINKDDCSKEEIKKWEDAKKYLNHKDCSKLDNDDDEKNDCDCVQKIIYDMINEKNLIETNNKYNNVEIKDCSLENCDSSEKEKYDNIIYNSKKSTENFLKSNFYKEHRNIFEEYAKKKNIDVNILYAIIIKEGAFNKNFQDSVRFECDYFNRHINNDDKKVPCTPNKGKVAGNKKETNYYAYLRAKDIDPELAFKSSSFGFAQIMGFNYVNLGLQITYSTGLVNLPFSVEFKYFTKFLEKNNLIPAIKDKNWDKISKLYNGKGYRQNNYQIAIRENYNGLNKFA